MVEKIKRIISGGYLGLIVLFLYAPILVLMVLSFNNSRSRVVWGGFTFKWYQSLFENEQIMEALVTTLLLALVAGAALLLFKSDGDAVIVSVDGEVIAEYPLSEDIEVEIKSDGGYNILIIEDGKARVESASCPDGICSAHRPIFRDGESIICLPNKVVIEAHASYAADGGADVIN